MSAISKNAAGEPEAVSNKEMCDVRERVCAKASRAEVLQQGLFKNGKGVNEAGQAGLHVVIQTILQIRLMQFLQKQGTVYSRQGKVYGGRK